jgi:hypothetical protein
VTDDLKKQKDGEEGKKQHDSDDNEVEKVGREEDDGVR